MEDFLAALAVESSIWQSTMRVNISKRPIDEGGRNATRFAVVLQASAVVLLPEGAEYLLEVGLRCGTDYHDSSNEMVGSETAEVLKKQLEAFAGERSWRILPGVMSE